jgi:hypothetical protein
LYGFYVASPPGANRSTNFAAHFPFGPPKGSENEMTLCGTIATQQILNRVNEMLNNGVKINKQLTGMKQVFFFS